MPLPLFDFVFKDLTMKGQWMYEPGAIRDMIKLMERGLLSFAHIKIAGKFGLSEWETAFDVACSMSFDEVTVMSGWKV